MVEFDTRLGQLAIARGLVSLSDLLRAVEEAGRTGRDVADVLLLKGSLSNAQLEELQQRVQTADDDLQAELERGQTIVLDQLSRSLNEPPPAVGSGGGEREPPITLEFELRDLDLAHESRYEMQDELGRGGMGRVFMARDRILERRVALKMLNDDKRNNEKEQERLLIEAQVTGLLEHPSIVPVYDLRATADGEPFYTMRVVQEKSLGQLISEIRMGDTAHSLVFLASVLRQVSLAIEFAHGLGVVHRDLKPENILVGKYGEVYVIDWGVAKIVSADIGLEDTSSGVMGQLIGTPAYMAPEQARGDNDAVNELSDVYALGAILYEILTLEPMFWGDHVLAILFQVVHETPELPRERRPDRNIPVELEEICMKALAKRPEQRYQSAQAFADELELFLEGVKERERRREKAEDTILEAAQVRAVYDEVREQYSHIASQLYQERERVESWASPEEKRTLWSLEQQAEDLEVEIERRFGEVVRTYGQALVHLPEMPEARRALADLYWDRFQEYEEGGQLAQAAYFEGLVHQYNDGHYDELLEGSADMRVRTYPAGADITVFRYQQVERRLAEWRVADVGPSPVDDLSVSHGSYVLEMRREGYRTTNVPVYVTRGSSLDIAVKLVRDDALPDDFVLIPSGSFICGKRAMGSELRRAAVGDFAMARYPVTVGEYIEFLNALEQAGDSEAAMRHAPASGDEIYFDRSEHGEWSVPADDPDGDNWQLDWPMFMVNYHDAEAFAQWRAELDRLPIRLPTMLEWEKAARGVDGRTYAWGNHFDAAFCAMRSSRKGRSLPEPVGAFAMDRSPYGLMDVCGNIAEWTSTQEGGSENVYYLGGASYNSLADMCRLDWVFSSPSYFKFSHYGFRLAMSID